MISWTQDAFTPAICHSSRAHISMHPIKRSHTHTKQLCSGPLFIWSSERPELEGLRAVKGFGRGGGCISKDGTLVITTAQRAFVPRHICGMKSPQSPNCPSVSHFQHWTWRRRGRRWGKETNTREHVESETTPSRWAHDHVPNSSGRSGHTGSLFSRRAYSTVCYFCTGFQKYSSPTPIPHHVDKQALKPSLLVQPGVNMTNYTNITVKSKMKKWFNWCLI